MAHGPFHDPDFDFDKFRGSVEQWASAGAKRLMIEWQTGPGPTVAWFPVGNRPVGQLWQYQAAPTGYNEQYADFLEYRLTPRLLETARGLHMEVTALCVDQQPIQVMRMRRRELERAELAAAGPGGHSR